MNQAICQPVAPCDHPHRRGLARLSLLAGLLAALLLAGCEPSPTSQALKSKGAETTVAEAPVIPEEPAEPEPVPVIPVATEPEPVIAPQPVRPVPVARIELSDAESPSPEGDTLQLLGETVPAGTSQRLLWTPSAIFEGVSTETPVLIVNGSQPGPTVCLTAAIHGDELNGIEMVRQVIHELEPDTLSGAVIGIPIVNLQGFRRGSRYLPDRRDLNRYFPGNPQGSSASRIAHSLFTEIVSHCDALIDLHTGSNFRTNLPQLRADLRYTQIRSLTKGFGGMAVLHSVATPGTLRRAASDAGIPAVTLEAGEPLRLQTTKVNEGVVGLQNLLGALDMLDRETPPGFDEPEFYESTWVRADHGGILFTTVELGAQVSAGEQLGTITNPITNEQNPVYSPESGRVLGMALNQVVMPGFAAFRIGIQADLSPGNTGQLSLEQSPSSELPLPAAVEQSFDPVQDPGLNDTGRELEEASE